MEEEILKDQEGKEEVAAEVVEQKPKKKTTSKKKKETKPKLTPEERAAQKAEFEKKEQERLEKSVNLLLDTRRKMEVPEPLEKYTLEDLGKEKPALKKITSVKVEKVVRDKVNGLVASGLGIDQNAVIKKLVNEAIEKLNEKEKRYYDIRMELQQKDQP